MSDPITYGGVVMTVFLVVLSLRAVRWWPPFYVAAVLFGFSTGFLAWSWPQWARDAWWSVWLVYAFALPIFRVNLTRRWREAQELERLTHILRETFSVDADANFLYFRDARGQIIDRIAHPTGKRAGA